VAAQHFPAWNDVMAAILSLWDQIKSLNSSVDTYVHEEYFCQISSWCTLKRRSLRLFPEMTSWPPSWTVWRRVGNLTPLIDASLLKEQSLIRLETTQPLTFLKRKKKMSCNWRSVPDLKNDLQVWSFPLTYSLFVSRWSWFVSLVERVNRFSSRLETRRWKCWLSSRRNR